MAKLRIKWKQRLTNPIFYLTIGATILASAGIQAETLTSWPILWEAVINIISNPFTLGCVCVQLIGDFYNPTTKGLGD